MSKLIRGLRLSALACAVISTNAAACFPNTGPVTTLTGGAALQFTALKQSFQATVVMPTTQTVVAAINNMKNVMTDSSTQLSQSVIEMKQQEVFNQIEMQRTRMELLNTYEIEVAHTARLSNAEIIALDGVDGGPAEQYFGKLCAADKARKAIYGEFSRTIALNATKNSEAALVQATKDIPQTAAARAIQNKHYNSYCSANSVEEGLCDVKATIPNADILSSVATNPSNDPDKAVLTQSAFKTEYTYSDFELQAAKDYYDNILLLNHLPVPRLNGVSVQHDVVARYNQLKSAQSLSVATFQNSMAIRTAIDDGDDSKRISKLDLLRFKLFKAETEDLLTAANANDNGVSVILYNSRVMGDQLRLMQLEAKERIANLQAAYLALKLSSSEYITYMNGKK